MSLTPPEPAFANLLVEPAPKFGTEDRVIVAGARRTPSRRPWARRALAIAAAAASSN